VLRARTPLERAGQARSRPCASFVDSVRPHFLIPRSADCFCGSRAASSVSNLNGGHDKPRGVAFRDGPRELGIRSHADPIMREPAVARNIDFPTLISQQENTSKSPICFASRVFSTRTSKDRPTPTNETLRRQKSSKYSSRKLMIKKAKSGVMPNWGVTETALAAQAQSRAHRCPQAVGLRGGHA